MRLNIKQLFEDESNDEEKDKTEEVDDNNVNNANMGEQDPNQDPNNMNGNIDPNDPNAQMQDPNAMAGGTDMYGQPMQPDYTPPEIGKIFILKKIYTRMISLNNYMDNFSERKLLSLKNKMREATELFKMIIDNFDRFKGNMDDIIKYYRLFLITVIKELDEFLKKKWDEEETGKNNSSETNNDKSNKSNDKFGKIRIN